MSESSSTDGPPEQRHISSRLMKESLMDRDLLRRTDGDSVLSMLPYADVLKIGGQSIIDRGRDAIMPIIEELADNIESHRMIIGVGGGTRSRHVYDLGLQLGLPTGMLAQLGGAVSEQNAHIIGALLGGYGAVRIPKDHFEELPLYLRVGCPCVVSGMPPYGLWEQPPEVGRIPAHRTDCGVYMISEVYGTRTMIFIKDVDGLYTDDPKKNASAEFIPRISVSELLRRDLKDLAIERKLLEMMCNARQTKSIQIVNGLKAGNITRALNNEHVGTIIHRDQEEGE
ncbi:MAG: uridine kinase [Candidatus Latescibacteria bacterium]|jgi:molybdenum storage protein|nr:uridine kinase [Candidatus Latescibacterota bacterium]